MRRSGILRDFTSTSFALFVSGFFCFAAFSWAVKWHFRRTKRIPLGTYLITVLTLAGFSWFTWRIIAAGARPAFWGGALILFVLSACLFTWTIKATRKTPPTLAFDTDEPCMLLNHGPYRYVRHPFYLSYLLFWIGTAVASPGLLPWLAPMVMTVVYWNAAAREARKFGNSGPAAAYQRYRMKAGMFLPRLSAQPIAD